MRRCPRRSGTRWRRAPSLPTALRGWLPGRSWTWLLALVHAVEQGCGVGVRTLLSPRHAFIHLAMNGGVKLVEFDLGSPAFSQHAGLETGDGVELAPLLEEVFGDVVGGIVRGVARHAERLALQKIRPVARARMGHGAPGGFVNRQYVVAIHDFGRHVVARAAVGHVGAS